MEHHITTIVHDVLSFWKLLSVTNCAGNDVWAT